MKHQIEGNYTENFNCELTHIDSNFLLQTDAPKDNQGNGACFSPTDLVAAALGSCIVTTVAIKAKAKNLEIGKPHFKIEKQMASNPRRISKISIEIQFDLSFGPEERAFIEFEAKNCPVAKSLCEHLIQEITFIYKP